MVIAIDQVDFLTTDGVDLGHTLVFETHEIRGVEKLVFSRGTEEDQGALHIFSAAEDD